MFLGTVNISGGLKVISLFTKVCQFSMSFPKRIKSFFVGTFLRKRTSQEMDEVKKMHFFHQNFGIEIGFREYH
jgi:hypothetical protein